MLLDLVGLTPVDAYRRDVAAAGRDTPFGSSDDGWLGAAHVLVRAARVGAVDRAMLAAADTQRARHARRTAEPEDAASAVRDALVRVLPSERPDEDASAFVAAVQSVSVDAERAGAFRLAFTMLDAARALLGGDAPAALGQLLAQQGRIARQLGILDAAADRYESAARLGRRARDPGLEARATLGLGVLANMRGNYPDARRWFERALRIGRRLAHGELVRAAHHGLLHGALAAGDRERALLHGWSALQGLGQDANGQAELLVNLAEICAALGATRAARCAFAAALERATLARVRMAALGGAITLAAALGDRAWVRELGVAIRDAVRASGQPFEDAMSCAAMAQAEARVGLLADAARSAATAGALARAHGFHEIEYRMDDLASRLAVREAPLPAVARAEAPRESRTEERRESATSRFPALSPASRRVLHALENLPVGVHPTHVA